MRSCSSPISEARFGWYPTARRHTAQERGNFRTRLREAEDVVDEEQRIRAFFVAEILGDRQSGQRDAQTRSGRLGHLAVNQRGLRLRRNRPA